MSDPTSADIAGRWLPAMTVLRSILLGLPLRIEIPWPKSRASYTEMIDTAKRTLDLLAEEPLRSMINPNAQSLLSDAIAQLILVEDELGDLLHVERGGEKAERWRYRAAMAATENAASALLLAQEELKE